MIKFADIHSTPLVRKMWKTVFGDSDQYIDLYFDRKYIPQNTLVYFVDGEAAASLQMLPYTIRFYGRLIPFYYLSGLCTLPEHRRKGYMEQLIFEAHHVMRQRAIPLSILVPAEEWLFGFYEQYQYQQVFKQGTEIIPLKSILQDHPDLKEAYIAFDQLQQHDFCVYKSFDDFSVIVQEYIDDGCPDKYNLAAMARIIDVKELLSLYAKANIDKSFAIAVDKKDIYKIDKGGCYSCKRDVIPDLDVDTKMLCRLLFGYCTGELGSSIQALFPVQYPAINLMLE